MNNVAFPAASASAFAISAPAHAAVFYATGTFEDGSVLTGTQDIDTAAGRVAASYLTTTGPSSAVFPNDETLCSVTAPCGRTGSSFYDLANSQGGAFLTAGSMSATAPVPEPAAWAMLVGGVGTIGGTLRRRAKTRVRFA